MVSTNDIRAGQVIIVNQDLMLILEQQHIKPGKGKAFVRTKLRNLNTNSIVEKTFRADEDVESAYINKEVFTFLFSSNNTYTFMNAADYSQVELSKDFIDESRHYLVENLDVTLKLYNNTPIEIELPTTVNLLVIESEPADRGDTVSSTTKKVTCNTGLELNVPLFININDRIKVDTRNGTYITRI